VDALRRRVRDWCEDEGLSTYDRGTHAGFLRNLVVREGRRTGQLQARLVTSPGDFRAAHFAEAADAHGVIWSSTANVAEVTRDTDDRILSGAEAIEERVGSLRFSISPDAFFQTNTEMAERLYSAAAGYAELTGSERLFDLFCGIGTIGLSLAEQAGEVWGVEIGESAVADAIANADLNGIENTRFFAGDIRTAARPLVEQAGKPDVVVVDPPRAGLSQKIVRRIAEMEPRRIVYVSCNPTTLAPNARQFVEAGCTLQRVQPVDMFPQTPHIECVALLSR
jgi:23S rRNA (uracil1939-C5)-methyltransferase